jgi:hypothetical protein
VYWFPKAHDHLAPGQRAGLVGTNSFSQNRARSASLNYVVQHRGVITDAVSTQDWPGEAAVDMSIVNWVREPNESPTAFMLDEIPVEGIDTALTESTIPLADVPTIASNRGRAYQGFLPGAKYDITLEHAQELLVRPEANYDEVVQPYLSGMDITSTVHQQPSRYVIDFAQMPLERALQFPAALDVSSCSACARHSAPSTPSASRRSTTGWTRARSRRFGPLHRVLDLAVIQAFGWEAGVLVMCGSATSGSSTSTPRSLPATSRTSCCPERTPHVMQRVAGVPVMPMAAPRCGPGRLAVRLLIRLQPLWPGRLLLRPVSLDGLGRAPAVPDRPRPATRRIGVSGGPAEGWPPHRGAFNGPRSSADSNPSTGVTPSTLACCMRRFTSPTYCDQPFVDASIIEEQVAQDVGGLSRRTWSAMRSSDGLAEQGPSSTDLARRSTLESQLGRLKELFVRGDYSKNEYFCAGKPCRLNLMRSSSPSFETSAKPLRRSQTSACSGNENRTPRSATSSFTSSSTGSGLTTNC